MVDVLIPDRIKIQIEKSYYIYERYHVNSVFAMLYHTQPLTDEVLVQHLRLSDQFERFDEHHYFISFAHTAPADVYKASENLVQSLDHYFNDRTSCMAMDTFDVSNSPRTVIQRLLKILEMVKNSPTSRIEDETALDDRL